MRTLCSVMALAITLTIGTTWPSVGEAQSKQSTARKAAASQQKPAQRPAKATRPSTAQKNCAGYAWWGCTGWDPDPNIRAMLARDVGNDD